MIREQSRMNSVALPVFWLLSTLALGVVWTGGVRLLGHDSFAYVDMVKAFAYDFPGKFGDWWPYGYPLAAVPLFRAGLSAFVALLIISVVSFAFIFWVAPRCLPLESRHGVGALASITAAAFSPLCAQLIVFNLSDPFFAAMLLAFAASLAHWPNRWAVAAAPLLALAGFSIRYVGVFAFGVVGLYALLEWRRLRDHNRLPLLFVSSVGIGLVTAGLLWSNVRASGHITGPQPIGQSSISTWPLHLADLGLALPAAFASTHFVQSAQRANAGIMFVAGLTIMAAAMIVIVVSWVSPRSPYSRPLALTAGGYLITIVTVRAVTPFEDLSSPRFLLPALFPLVLLLTSRPAVARSRLLAACGVTSIIVSAALATRGIAPDQRLDLGDARTFLARTLQPSDTVTVNLTARSLAAYFDNRFVDVGNTGGHEHTWLIGPINWDPARTTLTVLGARGTPASRLFDDGELRTVMEAVDAGRAEIVYRSNTALVLRALARP